MSRYLLQDLIFVREHREDKASKAVTMARRVVREAEEAVARCKAELEKFHEWRLQEEERLIQSIMMRPVKLGDITDIKLEIALLREKEMALKDQLAKTEGELDRAKEALEQARLAHRKATQDLEKLVEHRELWKRETELEAERLADLEMEDFQGPKGQSFQPEQASYELN